MKNLKENNGITLIALVITIIVMLILVAVTITVAVNGGLFDYAGKAAKDTNTKIAEEQDWANIESGKNYDDLIAKYTTSNSEDLLKLRKAYIEGNEEIMQEIEGSIQTLLDDGESLEYIKYNNNVYKLTFEHHGSGFSQYNIYTNVELLKSKIDVTQGKTYFHMMENSTINLKDSYKSDLFEDFTITCDDTSKITINGYIITAGTTGGNTTIVLTGKTSGKTNNVVVYVEADSHGRH